MKDCMHQIDLGVIIRLIMAILKKYWECVLQFLKEGSEGLAANKLAASWLQGFAKHWNVELAKMDKGKLYK